MRRREDVAVSVVTVALLKQLDTDVLHLCINRHQACGKAVWAVPALLDVFDQQFTVLHILDGGRVMDCVRDQTLAHDQ